MNLKDPIALALVRRSDGKLLSLQGLLKVDLPGTYVIPGARLEHVLSRKLEDLGVHGARLIFRWGAVAGWGTDNPRPVSVYDALKWSGTPSQECMWSTEQELQRGPRADLYRRLFAKLREGGEASVDKSGLILDAPLTKPRPYPCPKCSSGLALRNRKPGEPISYDCPACMSSFGIDCGELQRIPPIGGE